MAILPNISDQFGIQFEAGHRIDADWWTVRLVMYRYREQSNQFENWLVAEPGIHETDLQTLIQKLETFQDTADASANFDFEPFVEPSFHFALERIPHNENYCRVATLAIDMVGVVKFNVPSAYRENRMTLRFHTDEPRFRTFIEVLLKELKAMKERKR
jgi:hypothetical protein